MTHHQHVLIYGVGALGGIYGARLSRHAEVTLVGHWPEQLAALNATPLRIVETDGRETAVQLRAQGYDQPPPAASLILILTKASGTATAARHAAAALAPDGIAISLQNGLGHLDTMRAHLPAAQSAQGMCMVSGETAGPGRIISGGVGQTHLGGTPDQRTTLDAVAALMQRCDLPAAVSDTIDALIWGKLAINAAINPLAAILRVRNDDLIANPWSHAVMRAAVREVEQVAAALEISLPFPDAVERVTAVAQGKNITQVSMLQDVLRGVETEIEAINGAVMRTGAHLGIATPANTTLYHLVKALEATYDRRIESGDTVK